MDHLLTKLIEWKKTSLDYDGRKLVRAIEDYFDGIVDDAEPYCWALAAALIENLELRLKLAKLEVSTPPVIKADTQP